MKSARGIAIVSFTLILLVQRDLAAGRDEWTLIPIEGGTVTDLFVGQERTFVRTANAEMFSSRDQGQTWRRLDRTALGAGASFPHRPVAVSDSVLLAIGAELDLYASSDLGVSWQRLFEGLYVVGAAHDAVTGTLYAITYAQTLDEPPLFWRSDDNAVSWQMIGVIPGNEHAFFGRLVVQDGHVYFRQRHRFVRSNDGGATFHLDFVPSSYGHAFAYDPGALDVVFMNGSQEPFAPPDTLLRQAGIGAPWEEVVRLGPTIQDVHLDAQVDGRIHLATFGGLFESRDRGATWISVSTPPLPALPGADASFVAVATGPTPGQLWLGGGADAGIYVSFDAGESWTERNHGLDGVFATAVRFVGDRAVVGTVRGMYSLDERQVTRRSLAVGSEVVDLDAAGDGSGLVLAVDRFSRMLRSEDRGTTWEFGSSLEADAVAFAQDGSGVAYRVGSAIEQSEDGGVTWSTVITGSEMGQLGLSFPRALAVPDTSRIHVGGFAAVLSSYDGGETWTRGTIPVATQVARLFVDRTDPQRMFANDSNGFGMYASLDGGRTWTSAPFSGAGDPTPFTIAFDPVSPGQMYLGGRTGVEVSHDGGVSWRPMAAGIDATDSVWDLDIEPDRPHELIAATPRGIYRFTQVERCTDAPDRLCIDRSSGDGRFEVSLHWQTALAGGREGDAEPVALVQLGVDRGGLLHFGNPANPEVLVKVLDGCGNNGHFWVFASAATTLGYALTVRDLAADTQRVYVNPDGQRAATITDTRAFATCDVADPSPMAGTLEQAIGAIPAVAPGARSAAAPTASAAAAAPSGACVPDATTLCIDAEPGDRRFRVQMAFSGAGGTVAGEARALPLDALGVARGGLLHFGNARNPEVLVKVLDGCGNNDRFWVFFAAATTLGFELRVEDTLAGAERLYSHLEGSAADAVADTQAFATCGAP